MLVSEIKVRVRYGETDKMGYAYYGNYSLYFEVARVEMLREYSLTYRQMEDEGILLPVSSLNVKFIAPAYYDELLTIKTTMRELPGIRMKFEYEVINEKKELITKGDTTLVFIDAKTRKAIQAPDYFIKKISGYFN